tara:strand:+ start:157 stop:549 length:393 start_codon:yes stop_codon:yes gene_type:complete
MSSIFSKIVRGELPAYKIAEDEYHLAFLDIFPLAKGHVLVIPKEEIDNIFDMSPEKYSLLWMFAQRVAIRMRNVINCERIGVSVIGLEVPHAHIHLVPINTISDINFEAEKINFSEDEFEEIAKSIREAI